MHTCSHCGFPLDQNKKHIFEEKLSKTELLYGTDNGCILIDTSASEIVYLTKHDINIPDILKDHKITKDFALNIISEVWKTQYGTIIKKKKNNNSVPLSMWQINRKSISSELLWSWFKQLLASITFLNDNNIYPLEVNEELIFVQSMYNKYVANSNSIVFEGDIFSFNKGENTENAESLKYKNLTDLCKLFQNLILNEKWKIYGNTELFLSIITQTLSGEFKNSKVLYNEIKNIDRIYQSVSKKEVSKKDFSLKIKIGIISILFFISLAFAYFYNRSSEDIVLFDVTGLKTIVKKDPGVPEEIIIQKYKGKWNSEFPFNRIKMNFDGYLYANLKVLRKYNMLKLFNFQKFLGLNFKINQKFLKNPGILEILLGFNNINYEFNEKIKFIMSKKDFTFTFDPKSKTYKKDLSIEQQSIKWKILQGTSSNLIDKGENPIILTEGSKQILQITGYDASNTTNEVILLYWNPPTDKIPKNSLWDLFTGGNIPYLFVLRVYRLSNVIKMVAVLRFSRLKTTNQVAEYIKQSSKFITKINIFVKNNIILIKKNLSVELNNIPKIFSSPDD